jgi:predicted amidohydrolase YtcJ
MRTADRIFHNGKVITVDSAFTVCSAIAVAGNRILATGSDNDISALSGPNTEMVDLNGRAVIPGLIDTHAHLDREGLKSVYPSLAGATSIDDILQRIAELVKNAKRGEWIVTMPIGNPPSYWSPQDSLKERRWPTRWDLDRVSPDNPVYIRPIWGFWRSRLPIVSVLNSRALAVCNIDEHTAPPAPTVTLEKDDRGQLTGIITEQTFMSVAELTLLGGAGRFSHQDRVAALQRSMQAYASFGTTSVFEGHGAAGELLKAYYALKEQTPFSVRVNLLFSPSWTHFADIPAATLLGTWGAWLGQHGIGDDYLRVGGLYVCAEDESDPNRSPIENAMRASATPYTSWAGFHYDASLPRDKVKKLLVTAAANGIRCAAMTPDMLDMFVEVNRVVPISDRRWVIGHISTISHDEIAKIRDLGLVVSTHTNRYIWRTGAKMLKEAGPDGENTISPLASLIRAGVPVTFGTDNVPVSLFYPIWQSIARKDLTTGEVVAPGQKLSREQALRAATINGAYLTFEENQKGSIEPGKLADFVCLSDDLMTVEEDRIKDIVAEFTVLGGRTVFNREAPVGAIAAS